MRLICGELNKRRQKHPENRGGSGYESGEGLQITMHRASSSASSEGEDEPGKSLSGLPGSLLPELPQVASLSRARTCRG
jgi:hypothetical protein